MRLRDKTALVTGAASGFGRAIARRFAAEGANVAIVDLNSPAAQTVAADIGGSAMAVKCDVSKGDQVAEAVAAVIDRFGKVDIVVNNAGWSHKNQPLMEVDFAAFKRVYEINVDSIFHATKAVVPHWRTIGGGVMINVGSTAGIRPRPGLSWYNSSKGAVNLMTKTLAVELAPDGIRVCGLAPVMGATALLETFMGLPDTPENRSKFLASIPLGRLCEPEDMANAALYLASDEASFITGVILEVDGGRTI
ncbi:SDR family oxidoreductase [Rhizobium chutanense]|uniref:3-oxoacyl-ACP reductase n=1 Tax=Rhizobium chutanense TaxID=2035448 RepID=A0A2A6J6Y7_9HYPH|nr:SDR family oxidoreductase [Rhizobium chutanense]PDT01633.1 3-oxoacyl-ACP reductase [Rhizobium chutanense]RUM01177.1 SDR family oxidoreductase [Rhizobium chutanense]